MDNIHIREINNGYIVSYYSPSIDPMASGRSNEYYCVDEQAVSKQLLKLLNKENTDGKG